MLLSVSAFVLFILLLTYLWRNNSWLIRIRPKKAGLIYSGRLDSYMLIFRI